MKIVINPKYRAVSSFVKTVPEIFNTRGTLIYKARNQLKTYTVGGYELVVKRFRKPHLLNRIAYTFFRPSKAKRSYEHAFKLSEKGIGTPDPVAFLEEKTGGLLNRSYYISIYEKDYMVIREQMIGKNIDPEFVNQLAMFIAKMHEKGVLQKDLSPGNILWERKDGRLDFILVDINRTVFSDHPLSKETRYRNFNRISDNQEVVNRLAAAYARAASLDEKECLEKINRYNVEINKAHPKNT